MIKANMIAHLAMVAMLEDSVMKMRWIGRPWEVDKRLSRNLRSVCHQLMQTANSHFSELVIWTLSARRARTSSGQKETFPRAALWMFDDGQTLFVKKLFHNILFCSDYESNWVFKISNAERISKPQSWSVSPVSHDCMSLQIGSFSGQDERQVNELLPSHLDLPWVDQLLPDALLEKALLLMTSHSCRRKDEDCKRCQGEMHPSPVWKIYSLLTGGITPSANLLTDQTWLFLFAPWQE